MYWPHPSNQGKRRSHLWDAIGGAFEFGQLQVLPSKDAAPVFGHSLSPLPVNDDEQKRITLHPSLKGSHLM